MTDDENGELHAGAEAGREKHEAQGTHGITLSIQLDDPLFDVGKLIMVGLPVITMLLLDLCQLGEGIPQAAMAILGRLVVSFNQTDEPRIGRHRRIHGNRSDAIADANRVARAPTCVAHSLASISFAAVIQDCFSMAAHILVNFPSPSAPRL